MFFITKRKMNKIIGKYEEEKKELTKQLEYSEDERNELRLRYDCIKQDRVNAENLLKQNNKLIDWIEKILKEVGTCRVNTNTTFKIPILYDNDRNYINLPFEGFEKEYIIIPQIEIIKTKYKRYDDFSNIGGE